jgi:hypothetical protein
VTNETIACEVVYCEGWDPESRSVVHPLPEATARARHTAGEQYAVVLTAAGRPLVLIQVCWAADYAGVWLFDQQSRRDRALDFRRLPTADGDGMLYLRAVEQWRYGSAEAPEFDEDAATHSKEFNQEGERFESSFSWGDQEFLEIAKPRGPVPAFGDWAALAHLDEVLGSQVELRVQPDPPAGPAPAELPWQPPRPAQPPQLDEFFAAGKVFELSDDRKATVDVVDGGRLWLTSGRLIAGEPVPYLYEDEPFADTVEPAEYPLVLSVARLSDGSDVVAAARLVVSDAETVRWEPALRPGEDVRMLGDDSYFGVHSELRRLVLVDADVAESYEDTIEDSYDDFTDHTTFVVNVPEPESGANLLAVQSGWRDDNYPVWVGRAADGALTSFVFDFLVLG